VKNNASALFFTLSDMPLARAAPRRNTRRRFLRWDQLSFGPSRDTKLWSEKSCIDKIFHSSNPISVTLFCQEAAVPAGPEAGFELLSTSYRGHGK
jgi:hypothetical protein